MQVLEQHFDAAFDAPDGIKKLRELILTLAMQGKLVEQDSNDQPASELLTEIEAEKRRLVAERKIKTPKPLPPIEADEVPYEVPVGWEWVRLGEVINSIMGGGTPNKNNANFWGGDIPWASVKDLNVDIYLEDTIDKITYAGLSGSASNLIDIGSVIVCTRMGLGKIAINKIPVAINQDLKAIVLSEKMDKMYFFLKYKNYKIQGSGMTVAGIRQEELLNFLFPLPPLAEQRRIVARIDELMARCDELEALRASREQKRLETHTAALNVLLSAKAPDAFAEAWQFVAEHFGELHSAPKNVAKLRKAVLQLAVMGKLVAQDPSDPPARELLKEIEAEKNRLIVAGKIRASKPLPPVTEEEKPYQVPEGWEWVRFSEMATDVATGPFGSIIHQSDYIYGGIPLVNPSHMKDGQIIYDPSISISEVKAAELDSHRLFDGDIVMARRGEMGRCAVVDVDSDGFLCGTGSFVLRFTKSIDRHYVINLFRTSYAIDYLNGNSVGTTMVNLNHSILNNLPVLLPPAHEQRRIVAKIDQFMALCDQLEAGLSAQTSKQTELLSAVMAAVTPAITTPTRRAAPARAQAAWADPEASEAAEAKRRDRPEKVPVEATSTEGEVAAPKRRGRPPKNPVAISASIPSAISEADAIRRLEALKLERSRGERQVGLFDVSQKG